MIKDNFFGREEHLNLLEKRILDFKDGYRQNIAIIGSESIGKTSIIFNLLDKFCDNHIIPLYLEARQETVASFGRRFIGVLLYNFLSNSGFLLKEDLSFLINKSSAYIPKTVKKIKSLLIDLEKRKKDSIFTELLSLCELVHQETGKFYVVIFDEFLNLETLGIKNIYSEWSKLLMLQKNTLYIIISSLRFKSNALLSKELSLLFGNFQVIDIEPFNIRTSENYLREALKNTGLDKAREDFIIHFTGGYPFYLEIITKSLLQYSSTDLVDILEDLLFESSGILNQKFLDYLKRFENTAAGDDYVLLLYLISSGQNKLKDLSHIMRKTKKELDSQINYLLSVDAIVRNGDFLRINERVFGFWLKYVYKQKMQSLTFDAKNQKVVFRKNIEDMINEFLLSANKSLIERVKELLNLFGNDIMQVERKRLRLAHFREIKPVEFDRAGIRQGLICRSADSLWIIAFKQNPLTETDIVEFAQECKKYRYKLQRKIIITSEEPDDNSRLRALEEKVWTWDLNKLNQILDLYSRPRII